MGSGRHSRRVLRRRRQLAVVLAVLVIGAVVAWSLTSSSGRQTASPKTVIGANRAATSTISPATSAITSGPSTISPATSAITSGPSTTAPTPSAAPAATTVTEMRPQPPALEQLAATYVAGRAGTCSVRSTTSRPAR